MKTKELTPQNVASVQCENAATVSRDGNAIVPQKRSKELRQLMRLVLKNPFVVDDAEY